MHTPNIGEKSRRLDNETRMDEGVAEAASSSMTSICGALQVNASTQRSEKLFTCILDTMQTTGSD